MRTRKIIESLIHISIWTIGYVVFVTYIENFGAFRKSDGTIFYPITLGTLYNIILFYTISLLFIPQFSKTKKTLLLIFKVLGLLLTVTLFESVIDHFFLVNYYSTEAEPYYSTMLITAFNNIFILAISLGYGFTKNWIKTQKQQGILKEEKLKAELDFLKAQINPHFLFNVLNTAFSSASKHGDDQTANIIVQLSDLLRYMLYESNVDRIDVEKEVRYIENYILLHKLRLCPDIAANINFVVDVSSRKQQIAPLILIPFVENALKYGVRLNKKTDISISLKIEDEVLLFTARNTINKTQNSLNRSCSGIGHKNAVKRLQLLYPDEHKLNIKKEDDLFIVELKINISQTKASE